MLISIDRKLMSFQMHVFSRSKLSFYRNMPP